MIQISRYLRRPSGLETSHLGAAASSPLNSPGEQINYGTGREVNDETIADAKEPLQIEWAAKVSSKFPLNYKSQRAAQESQ